MTCSPLRETDGTIHGGYPRRRIRLFPHLVCNQRKVRVPFPGNGDLLPGGWPVGLCCRGRIGLHRLCRTSGQRIVPWLPVLFRHGSTGRDSRWFSLVREHDRSGNGSGSCERGSAPVAIDGLSPRIGGAAGRADPECRIRIEACPAPGAEPGLAVERRVSAAAADKRCRRDPGTAPVAEKRQKIGDDTAARGADRVRVLLLLGDCGAAPVAEYRLIVKGGMTAFSTGLCHVRH